MKKATIMMATLLLISLTNGAWAAKKGRLSSPPPSKSNVAAETKAVTQKQSATQSPTRTATQNATAPHSGMTIQKGTQPATVAPENELQRLEETSSQSPPTPTYQIPWQSVNGGGGPLASANYSVNMSVGQATIGYSSSASYQAGIGYWYGVGATTGCSCPFQCDYDSDGFLTSLDLGDLIDVLFAGAPEVTDPDCPSSRGDFDCDGFPTSLDLGNLIDHLFAGGPPPCDPCSP